MTMNNIPIEVIAYYGTSADKIRPLRFRIKTDSGIQVIKIKNPILKINNGIYLAYNSNIVLNNIKYQCEIHYMISDMRWVIFEIR